MCELIIKPLKSKIKLNSFDLLKLIDDTKFMHPAFHKMKNKRQGWDGYIRRVNAKGEFYTGYTNLVLEWCKENNIEVNYEPTKLNISIWDEAEFKLAEHQRFCVQSWFDSGGFGVIEAATNSGKSLMILSIIKSLSVKTLVLIHNSIVFNQLQEMLSKYCDLTVINSDTMQLGEVTLAMQKTFFNRLKIPSIRNYIENQVELIVVDECHRAGGETYFEILSNCYAPYKLGLSGTPFDSENFLARENVIRIFGSSVCKVTNEEMIEKEVSSKVEVHFYPFKYNPQGAFLKVRNDVMLSNERITLLKRLTSIYPDNQVIICERLEYAEKLSEILNIPIIHGAADKEFILKAWKNGEITKLISTSVIQEGVNMANIRTLFLYDIGKSTIKVKQYVGRGLRKKQTNDFLTVVDFMDSAKYLSNHALERQEIYKKENFNVKIIEE